MRTTAKRAAPYPSREEKLSDRFNRYASAITEALGSFLALILSVVVVLVWALTGPIFGFSDTWQLVINTSTTIVTFWMVFVIQNSANRDAKAIHLKLDEIIRATQGARNSLITLETAPEDVVAQTAAELASIAEEHPDAAAVEVTVKGDGRETASAEVSRTARPNGDRKSSARGRSG